MAINADAKAKELLITLKHTHKWSEARQHAIQASMKSVDEKSIVYLKNMVTPQTYFSYFLDPMLRKSDNITELWDDSEQYVRTLQTTPSIKLSIRACMVSMFVTPNKKMHQSTCYKYKHVSTWKEWIKCFYQMYFVYTDEMELKAATTFAELYQVSRYLLQYKQFCQRTANVSVYINSNFNNELKTDDSDVRWNPHWYDLIPARGDDPATRAQGIKFSMRRLMMCIILIQQKKANVACFPPIPGKLTVTDCVQMKQDETTEAKQKDNRPKPANEANRVHQSQSKSEQDPAYLKYVGAQSILQKQTADERTRQLELLIFTFRNREKEKDETISYLRKALEKKHEENEALKQEVAALREKVERYERKRSRSQFESDSLNELASRDGHARNHNRHILM